MEIDIPYSKFQKILQKLRVMIQTIREFHDLGITMMRKILENIYIKMEWENLFFLSHFFHPIN